MAVLNKCCPPFQAITKLFHDVKCQARKQPYLACLAYTNLNRLLPKL